MCVQQSKGKGFYVSSNILSVKLLAQKHTAFTEASIRHLIFYKKINGFDVCVRRVGRRVYILEDKFLEFIDKYNSN